MFVEPKWVLPTLTYLRDTGVVLDGKRIFYEDLRARHIICSSTYLPEVLTTLNSFPKNLGVKVRTAAVIMIISGVCIDK